MMKVNLPVDIETNILSKLPVKTIGRFRSVCKSWYSLVINPYFINMHQRNKPIDNNNSLLVVLLHKSYDIVVVDTASVVHSSLVVKPQVGSPVPIEERHIGGSCDGIVCVYGVCNWTLSFDHLIDSTFSDYIILWNRTLGIIKSIRNCLRRLDDTPDVYVGFGFHNHSNDYKVLRFEICISSIGDVFTRTIEQVEIYSLSSGSWRTIKAALPPRIINFIFFDNGCYRSRKSGVYVNGAHHWSARIERDSPNNHKESVIISFDMGDEVFREIMLPTECLLKRVILFNYKDWLSMLIVERGLCSIWVMKEYGGWTESSWTKLCKVAMPPQLMRSNLYFVGMGIIDNEELVLRTQGDFMTGYDPLQQQPVVIDIDKSQMKDRTSCFTANIEILKHAIQATTFTQSLLLIT